MIPISWAFPGLAHAHVPPAVVWRIGPRLRGFLSSSTTYRCLVLLALINADDIFYFILHNVADRWELWHAFQLSLLINAGGAIISWLLQLIIHNRPGSGPHQMATSVLGGDSCGKSERAMTRNVWRGRQWKVTGKNLTAWRHKEVSGNGALVSPAIILSRLWQ